ncbi:MAG: DegV family protein [Clostridium sp.]|uniref:DegV family protein n=1 Tax=Clostridium sp. TaxID=1506 RepID=UPI00267290AC|nr:DegV family protein [uncultured Clostridium sp.]
MAIKIVTDSTSYIPEEFINKYDISVVSLNVIMNGESIREVDLDNETFYSKMEESTEIPSSSQPSPDEIYNTFENIIKEGNSIVGIFISSDMSGTVSSANLIKNMLLEKYPTAHIEIVDSRSNCMQMGYVAIEAAKAAAAGKSMEEVIDVCTSVINNSRFLFTPDTLDYLKKGGRIGGASALLGTLFQIKPILTVCDGKTTVFTKVRTKKKAVDTLVTTLVNDLQGKELGGVIVHHINCQDEGLILAAKIKKQLGVDVQIDTIGPIIGLHVGPGSIGVAYFTK